MMGGMASIPGPPVRPSSVDDPIAMEKGRLFAARAIAADPEARKRVEDRYGVDYCIARYPEAYPLHRRVSRYFRRVIARIKRQW
jgi:hypothetical protein